MSGATAGAAAAAGRLRAAAYGVHYAAATGHHLATRAAMDVLDRDGTLVDAMVAASAVLAVVLPHATSLGGCAMMVAYDAAAGRLLALDGSGRAPRMAVPALFERSVDGRGPRSWLVPGLAAFWQRAHQAGGRLPWHSLFAPAIDLAANGMALSAELSRNLHGAAPAVRAQPGFAEAFLVAGEPPPAGAAWRQPALAWTLGEIAEGGERAFYHGQVARRLAQFSADAGGLLDERDLAGMQAQWCTPVVQGFGGWRAAVMPPNSVGVLMLAQLQALGAGPWGSREDRLYRQVQLGRTCLAGLRDRVADPAAQWPWQGPLPEVAGPTAGRRRDDPGDTAGIVLADTRGNGLAMLQSVFQPWGSGCIDPGTGILMNNRLSEFSLAASAHNRLAPGARPVHTLNPYLVMREGRLAMLGVSPGGISQTTTGVQAVTNALVDRMPLTAAIDAPRWSLTRDCQVHCEPGFPQEVLDRLHADGVVVQADSLHEFYFGSVKALRYTAQGSLEAAADLRREACALAR